VGGHDDAGHDVLWTMLGHTSGQWIASDMLLHLVKDDPQGQGSAITYARRYSLCSAIGLVADDDDDGQAASKPKQRSERPNQERRTPAPSSPPEARTEAPSGQPTPFQQAHAYASERGLDQSQWRDVLRTYLAVTAENLEAVIESINEVALGAPSSEGAA
jgi:hypothetical protein